MVTKRCPRCNQFFTIQDGCSDFIHRCNSGTDALDEEDVIRLAASDDVPISEGWNLRGIENKANPSARIAGNRIHDRNARGKIKSIFNSRQHYEFIEIKDSRVIEGGM